MSRMCDVLYFLCQIFFPNWTNRKDNDKPTRLQKIMAAIFLYLTSRDGTGTFFSIILHLFILAVLSLIMIPKMNSFTGIDILGGINIPGIEQPVVIAPQNESLDDTSDPLVEPTEPTPIPDTPVPVEQPIPAVETGGDPGADTIIDLTGEEQMRIKGIGGFVDGGGFQHRTPAGRQRAMQHGDSSQRGEAAVEAALEWLAAHRQRDGGWSFHHNDNDFCRCSHSGTSPSNRRAAATALALLAFLGAGHSHQTEGRYKTVVEEGLRFLIDNPNGGINGIATQRDELRMYSHGLAAIALCEAYAMNRVQDPGSKLGRAAQKALLEIETAQDSHGGGWRYRPGQQPGDTSIFSWQLMALKSGKIGGLHVSQSVLYAAQDFLESVKLDGGRQYQYLPSGEWDRTRGEDSPKTCTAIGLLMRMYLGWKPGDPFLDDGMEQVVRWGHTPREGNVNLYYAYYATLALHHYGGEHWDAWNRELQELLIQTQSRRDCEAGSWYFPDSYCDYGGRLLNTALTVMILETPYRIMPLYREIR